MKPGRNRTMVSLAIVAGALIVQACQSEMTGGAAEIPMFEVNPLWPEPLPNHWLLGSVTGLAIDDRDHVFVVNRTDSFNQRTEIGASTDPPTGECCLPSPNVLEFDAAGNLISSWGGPGTGYAWPATNHGLAIAPDGSLWIGGAGDADSHIVRFSLDGQFLGNVGQPAGGGAAAAGAGGGAASGTEVAGERGRGGRGQRGGRGGRRGSNAVPPNSTGTDAFGGPAAIGFAPDGSVAFVADGYRNRRVAVVEVATGAIQRFWGAYGEPPVNADVPEYDPAAPAARQFRTPVTCAEVSNDGMVYVCDRASNRIQVFRSDGTFVTEKVIEPETRGAGSVWDVAFSHDADQRFLYVADGSNMKVHILDRQSLEVLSSFGDGGRQPGQFIGLHSIAVDSEGNLYTAETHEGKRVQKFIFKGLGPVPADRGVAWPDTAR